MIEDITKSIEISKQIANKFKGIPWGTHNELINSEVISIEQFKKKVLSLKNKKVAAALSILYLTGSRISEILRSKDKKTGEYLPGIKFKDIKISNNGQYVIITTKVEKIKNSSRAKKNPQLRKKKAFIKYDKKDVYFPLFNILDEYMDSLPNDLKNNPETELFKFSYQYFAKYLSNHLGWNPHYIRHLRASHLAQNHNFNDTELRHFFGWITGEMPSRYTHINDEVVMNKLFTNPI